MKSESWIIAELGGALVLLAGLSFFYRSEERRVGKECRL